MSTRLITPTFREANDRCHQKTFCSEFLLIAFLFISTAGSIFAQMDTGTILGTVKDPSGAAIPGAAVTITDTATGITKSFITDSNGAYVVPYLIPGSYTVSAAKQGFRKVTKTGIVLQVDQKARVDIVLQLGSVTQTVTVNSQAPLVETASSEQGQVITAHTIVAMPLNTRDFAQLVSLNAGAQPGKGGLGGNISTLDLVGASDNNVNGLPVYANNFQIDGVTDNQDFYGTLVVNPSVDAIQEFKVTNNNYSAEFGRAGGANIQIAIKSGTNQFHGVGFEFFRNSALEANNFFSNSRGLGIPPYRQNQFGGNLGGPMKKDNTFFFANYEGLRTRLGQTGILTVPTELQRNGVFTETNPLTGSPQPQLYNPFTGQPFANNTIPSSMINPAAQNIEKLIPLPNITGPNGRPLLVNNYFGSNSLADNRDELDARVDHRFSDRDQSYVRYSYLSGYLNNPPFFGVVAGGSPAGAGYASDRSQNLAINEVHTFSPRTLNEFRFGLNRFHMTEESSDYGLNTAQQVGIPGLNNSCGYCSGLPQINIAGLSPLGHSTAYTPTVFAITQFQYVDNLTLIRGKHSIKLGADIRRYRDDLFTDASPVGTYTFDQNFTSNKGAAGTGIGAASFLLGYYEAAQRQITLDFPASRGWEFFTYAQDDFQAKPDVTLNLGVRYEVFTPNTDAHNDIANFDLASGDMLLGCIATSCTGGIETDWGLVEPRLGFAYSPDHGKTAIRSGFGMGAYSPAFGGQVGTLQQNYPFIQGQILTPPSVFTPGTSISQGFPAPPPVEYRPGAPLGHIIPQGGAGSGIPFAGDFWMDPNQKMPRVYQWSFDVQRSLTPNTLLDASYVGNVSTNGFFNLPFNLPAPGQDLINPITGQHNTLQERRPYYSVDPLLGQFNKRLDAGRSHYDALQLKFERRFSHGLSFLASYTASKTLQRGFQFHDPANYMVDTAPPIYDTPQRLAVSYVYQLPFGRQQTFGRNWNRATDALLGGWQVSGITSYMTGFPFQPTITSTLDNGYSNLPNRVCNGALPNPTIQRWYNTNCFVAPPLDVYGNEGFGILRGPGFRDWDVAVMKNFVFTESRYLQFRAEFFNLPNNVDFGLPNTLECGGLCGEGTITSLANNPREVQFALKVYF